MTALGKLFRTTAFKLIAVYLLVFALFAGGTILYLARHTQQLVVSQITETIESELRDLKDVFIAGGIARLVDVVEARVSQPGSNLYVLTTYSGTTFVSNADIPNNVLALPGWQEISYHRSDEPGSERNSRALVKVEVLDGGFRLLVGRDFEERDRLRQILAQPARWAVFFIVLLGVAGGVFVARRVLKRVDAMTATGERIMLGDLTGRLPVTGTGDEFDRLANSLNTMLERIEALMSGLKQVSDNIAHDLKTPLTRLRNHAEEALRSAKSETDYQKALHATIDESDGLIRTFDALLLIARAEAGEARKHMTDFDAADLAQGIAELYEPLAEEKGMQIEAQTAGPLRMHGNRELIGQALVNLVDNALKYGAKGKIRIEARMERDKVLLIVSDRGPGIPEKDRGRVKERFVRLEESRSQPGAGLGLSLVAAVAHLHGGELKFDDNSPGLRATLALPAKSR